MAGNRQPTLFDVARHAGVSKSAASRAFTGGSVSDETRLRVIEAARELRYRPSQAGRSLKTNRSRLIGLAVTHLDNQFYPKVIQLISEVVAQRGSRLVLFITHGQTELEPMLDELLGFGLDGVILASTSLAADVARECLLAFMPVMMLNNVDPAGALPGVSTDNELGGRLLAEHLISCGHRAIGVITGVADSSTSRERTQAFCDAMRSAGLPPATIRSGEYNPEVAGEAVRAMLADNPAITAIFCLNDHMAFAALDACRAMGRKPGHDIAVCGFDDVPISRWPPFSLTSYAQPIPQMVEACVDGLFAQIDGKPVSYTTQQLAGSLIVRASSDFTIG